MSQEKKSPRRKCRIACMQYLYGWSINPPESLGGDLEAFFAEKPEGRDFYGFAEELIFGALENLAAIDAKIGEMASNWEFRRIAKIDLAILRMAFYEMLFRKDIPPVVTINEAIDLSKEYSTAESRRFINGILDRLRGELGRPSRAPSAD